MASVPRLVKVDSAGLPDSPTLTIFCRSGRDDGGTEQDSKVSVWNVIRQDVAPTGRPDSSPHASPSGRDPAPGAP